MWRLQFMRLKLWPEINRKIIFSWRTFTFISFFMDYFLKNSRESWTFKNVCLHYEAHFSNHQKGIAELKKDLKLMIESDLFLPKPLNSLKLLNKALEVSCQKKIWAHVKKVTKRFLLGLKQKRKGQNSKKNHSSIGKRDTCMTLPSSFLWSAYSNNNLHFFQLGNQ